MNTSLSDSDPAEPVSLDEKGRVKRNESKFIEFKEKFNWENKKDRADYIKEIAAFANTKGGYLIFGVKDNPKELVGIGNSSEQIDDADITNDLNNYLAPSVDFQRVNFSKYGFKLCLIEVKEAQNKPIVCIKQYPEILNESAVYYRYSSKSEVIKSSDLIQLINKAKEEESRKWMDLFSKVSKVGVENAGIYNVQSGEINTSRGKKFVLDEKLMQRLKVIDKYSEEESGAEAVRVIGDVKESGVLLEKPKLITENELICDFLDNKSLSQPSQYLKAICYQTSATLPVYYYIYLAGEGLQGSLELINKENKSSPSKDKMVNRLKDDSGISNLHRRSKVNTNTSAGIERRNFYNKIKKEVLDYEEVTNLNEKKVRRLTEALVNLKQGSYNQEYVHKLKKKCYEAHYQNKNLSHTIRQSVAYLDYIEYQHLLA